MPQGIWYFKDKDHCINKNFFQYVIPIEEYDNDNHFGVSVYYPKLNCVIVLLADFLNLVKC